MTKTAIMIMAMMVVLLFAVGRSPGRVNQISYKNGNPGTPEIVMIGKNDELVKAPASRKGDVSNGVTFFTTEGDLDDLINIDRAQYIAEQASQLKSSGKKAPSARRMLSLIKKVQRSKEQYYDKA